MFLVISVKVHIRSNFSRTWISQHLVACCDNDPISANRGRMCGQLCWDSESSSTTRWLSKTSPSLVSEPVSCRVSEPLTSSSFGETTGLALESSNEDSGEVLDFPCPPSSASLSDLHPTASSCRHVSSRYNILSKFRATIADWSLDDDGRRERFGGPKRNRDFRNLYCFFRK